MFIPFLNFLLDYADGFTLTIIGIISFGVSIFYCFIYLIH